MAITSVRQIIFGSLDGLIVPLGVASGVAGGTHSAHAVLVAGLGEAFAGALSMGVGEEISDETDAEQTSRGRRHRTFYRQSAWMSLAYIVAALVPLWPYVFWPLYSALIASIVSTVFALVLVGIYKGHTSGRMLYSIVQVVLAGTLSAGGSDLLGTYVPQLLGH